ncbi:hypothetical protein WP50_10115 [Lactiplantibacillus plantarum]|nr:hypothetical protein WP50_10115 [Lactiplantibacillus plantarum]
MEKHGVKIMTNSMITEVCEDHVNLKGKDPIPTYTLIWTAGVRAINMLNRTQAGKAAKYMEKHGVKIMTNSMITEVCEDHVNLKGKDPIPTYTLIWTAGVRANSIVKKFGIETNPRGGRLMANEFMQAKDCNNIN